LALHAVATPPPHPPRTQVMLARAGGDRVPWAYVHGLIENSVYGGRVDNPSDARVLRAYLALVLHPDVRSSGGADGGGGRPAHTVALCTHYG